MTIEITDNSGLVKEEMQAAVLRALTKCGLAAEGFAKKLCPTDTGNLKNSITHLVDQGGDVVYIGSAVEYAAYVQQAELGTGIHYPGGRQTPWTYQDSKGQWHITHGQRAQPYLKPAIADHTADYKRLIESELKNG